MTPDSQELDLLRLLHLADSALPIGAAAHSFGVETLVDRGYLTVGALEEFLEVYLTETGQLEAAFCRAAYRHGQQGESGLAWVALNRHCSAYKPARESREASAVLGRRLLQLVLTLASLPVLQSAWEEARSEQVALHHACVFGLVGGGFGLGEDGTVQAYLHQSLAGLLAACQKLMPLGQTKATEILWALKPQILQVAAGADGVGTDQEAGDLWATSPLLDWGAMGHATLPVRLFVS